MKQGVGFIGLLWLAVAAMASFGPAADPVPVAKGWPRPVYKFRDNPVKPAVVQLGRMLFYDPILSADTTVSCASCHNPYNAFAHTDHQLSHGIRGAIGMRNAPTLANLAWKPHFMIDGAVHHLDFQALAPLTNPEEMAETLPGVVKKLNAIAQYRRLFTQAWGDSLITGERFLKAMSQFMLTLVSNNSKYDQVMRKEAGAAFTEQESRGLALFRRHCASCHAEPLFTNHRFASNGLALDPELNDWGRMRVTKLPADSLLFQVPTLRNIEFTFPYMHDGRYRKISQVLQHYNSLQKPLPGSKETIQLSDAERVELTAFLLTLTDRRFLFNKELGPPSLVQVER